MPHIPNCSLDTVACHPREEQLYSDESNLDGGGSCNSAMNMEVWVREKINLVTDLHFLLVKQTNILSGQGTSSGFGDCTWWPTDLLHEVEDC